MYKIGISKEATKYLSRLDTLHRERIYTKITLLSEWLFDRLDIKPIAWRANLFRIRVGDFRVIYSKKEDILLIEIIQIWSRGNIYKKV